VKKATLIVLLAGAMAMGGVSSAQAAARVFVSVNGSDTNDCSIITTPCRTFAESVTQVDAGGEVIVIDTGSYGPTTITKSVKINVPAGVIAFLAGTMTVNAGPTDVVVLRGLTIKALTEGTGDGILFQTGAALYIERCVIDGFSNGIDVTNTATGNKVFVTDTTSRNNSEGLFGAPTSPAQITIARSRLQNNSDCGFWVRNGALVARDSEFTGNNGGICPQGTVNASIESSLIANNANCGSCSSSSGGSRFSRNIITGNAIGIAAGGTAETLSNNLIRGNVTNVSGTLTAVSGN
jgi:parallel beta-helix repeat protein